MTALPEKLQAGARSVSHSHRVPPSHSMSTHAGLQPRSACPTCYMQILTSFVPLGGDVDV